MMAFDDERCRVNEEDEDDVRDERDLLCEQEKPQLQPQPLNLTAREDSRVSLIRQGIWSCVEVTASTIDVVLVFGMRLRREVVVIWPAVQIFGRRCRRRRLCCSITMAFGEQVTTNSMVWQPSSYAIAQCLFIDGTGSKGL